MKLKKCPFCGEQKNTQVEQCTDSLFCVVCSACETWGPKANTRKEAKAKWQARFFCEFSVAKAAGGKE